MLSIVLTPIYETLVRQFALWGLATLGLGVALWHTLPWLLRVNERRTAQGATDLMSGLLRPMERASDWAWLSAFCLGVMAVADGHGFTRGFFQYDDFAFMQNAREELPFLQYLNLYHSDHSLPLYRLQVWLGLWLAGGQASAELVAVVFNGISVISCFGLLLGGCWVLAELGACRLVLMAFIIGTWCWPGWGEFTAGFYTIMVYPQTVALGLPAVALVVRFGRTGQVWAGAVALLLTAMAAWLDVAGMWVFPVMLVFAAGQYWVSRRSGLLWLAGTLLATGAAATLYYLVLAKHSFIAIELVQNPSGTTMKGYAGDNLSRLAGQMPLKVVSGVGGVAISTFTPPMIREVTRKVVASPALTTACQFAELAACVTLGWCAIWVGRRVSLADRLMGGAMLAAAVVLISMVVIARARMLPEPGMFWHPKYLCMPYCWMMLAICFQVDRVLKLVPTLGRNAGGRWLGIGMALVLWSLVPHWFVEKSVAIPGPWHPGGRWRNTEVAELRRRDFDDFAADMQELARKTGRRELLLPPVTLGYDGASYPYLELGMDATGSNYLWSDLLAIAPRVGLRLREVPHSSVPPEILDAIAQIPRLKRFFHESGI